VPSPGGGKVRVVNELKKGRSGDLEQQLLLKSNDCISIGYNFFLNKNKISKEPLSRM
jgi:hypothetical protein